MEKPKPKPDETLPTRISLSTTLPSGESVTASIKPEVLKAALRVQEARRHGWQPDEADIAILVMATANETDDIVVEHASTDRRDNEAG